jgi:hypothetical protein
MPAAREKGAEGLRGGVSRSSPWLSGKDSAATTNSPSDARLPWMLAHGPNAIASRRGERGRPGRALVAEGLTRRTQPGGRMRSSATSAVDVERPPTMRCPCLGTRRTRTIEHVTIQRNGQAAFPDCEQAQGPGPNCAASTQTSSSCTGSTIRAMIDRTVCPTSSPAAVVTASRRSRCTPSSAGRVRSSTSPSV